jgi:hypothetical protein
VLEEVRAGDDDAARRRVETIRGFAVLEATAEAEALTTAIVRSRAIPKRAVRDAAHIGVAAVSNMDYLLTWNCRHLANGQIIRAVSGICAARGHRMPVICTPEELMGV